MTIFKVLCLAVVAMVAQYAQGHGHAFSSQHISRHDGPAEVVHVKGHAEIVALAATNGITVKVKFSDTGSARHRAMCCTRRTRNN
ncbi:hypothetical protein O3G_MSEX013929 [Manduca sexta]|uniref:Uncharacterized protein n=1 Tax=Manduca sexta TaxID=7130 RepID=A0A921ZU70_MANSE|nr:hypothetical protein O3G_MSEX013929 [Manduca sexta]